MSSSFYLLKLKISHPEFKKNSILRFINYQLLKTKFNYFGKFAVFQFITFTNSLKFCKQKLET